MTPLPDTPTSFSLSAQVYSPAQASGFSYSSSQAAYHTRALANPLPFPTTYERAN